MNSFLNPDLDNAVSANVNSETPKAKYVKRSEDTRFIKVSINNPSKTYQAIMRVLPQGVEGLKNNKPFYVVQKQHFIREGGKVIVEKCRKTLGEHEHCPFCEANWAMYNLGKRNNDEAMKKRATQRAPVTSYIANVFIRQDANVPQNSGKVFLYEYRQTIHDLLMIPIVGEKKAPAPVSLLPGVNLAAKKEVGRFVPYNPINGKDFYLIVNEDPKNEFPSYTSSQWADGFSQLAATEEEIMGILNQCHDLTEFTADVKSVEAMTIRLNELAQQNPSMFIMPESTGGQHTGFQQTPQPQQLNAGTFFAGATAPQVPDQAPPVFKQQAVAQPQAPAVDPNMVNMLAGLAAGNATGGFDAVNSMFNNGLPAQEITSPVINNQQSIFESNVDASLSNDSDDDDLPF